MKRSWPERIGRAALVIAGCGLVWMGASWVNVIAHNCTDCVYAWWNLFTIAF